MSQEIVRIVVNSVDILDVSKLKNNMDAHEDYLKKIIEYTDTIRGFIKRARKQNPSEIPKCYVDKNDFKIPIKQLHIDNDQLLNQIMSQEIVRIVVNSVDILDVSKSQSVEKVKKDIDEIETINIELEHSAEKLLFKNGNLKKEREHLKSIYEEQFDSIKKTCVRSKEHSDSLIDQINAKSVKNSDLNAQLQEKVFAIAALKNKLRKLKGKNIVDTAVSTPITTIIALGMFKLYIEPIFHRLKNNMDAHEDYLKKIIEYTDTIRGFIKRARKQNPSEPLLHSACRFAKHVQELLDYVSKTCPNLAKPSRKLVVVTPLNKDKRVRFADP
nr:hypothetical protein [Tanacetum cinerariifolium]